MRAPKKVIAAMAMATLIGTGVGQAFAAELESDFKVTTGAVGEKPFQTTEQKDTIDSTQANVNDAEGYIQINGEFTKYVSSFPEESENGRYLRVSMPLSLNYKYDVNNNELTSAEGIVRNQSVYINNSEEEGKKSQPQAIKVSFLGIDNPSKSDAEYVKTVTNVGDKLQLPFQLVVSKNGSVVKSIPLVDLSQEHLADLNTITVEANNNLKLEIKKIGEQSIGNPSKLDNGSTSISNNMHLQFEYAGK